MCYFISLVVGGLNEEAVSSVLRVHDRRPFETPSKSIVKVLMDGERHFFAPAGHCDCGTVLAQPQESEPRGNSDAKLQREIAKLVRKGWTDAKIERWLKQKEDAEARPKPNRSTDSIEHWQAVLSDLSTQPEVSSVGYLVHFYSGDQRTELFSVSRKQSSMDEVLMSLGNAPEDTLMVAEI